LEVELTVTDPVTFTKPWTLENGLWRADGGIYEVACHEGNIGLRGIWPERAPRNRNNRPSLTTAHA
jgi:hypothetical protein